MTREAKYIEIKKCSNHKAWYYDRIGEVFKVSQEVEYEKLYLIEYNKSEDKSSFGLVDICDVEQVYPNLIKRIFTFWNK